MCGAQVPLLCGFSCTNIIVPDGAIVVRLYSNIPFIFVYDEILGFSLEGQRRLSVISAWSRSWSQFCIGKFGSVENNPDMKWYFNMMIARLSTLWWCITGEDVWKYIILSRISFWKVGGDLLSIIIYYGLSPLMNRCSLMSLKTRNNSFYFIALW